MWYVIFATCAINVTRLCVDRWPPTETVTHAAQKMLADEAARQEARKKHKATTQLANRKPWRTVRKRMLDWAHGWLGPPPDVDDPDQIMSYEDWLLISGHVLSPVILCA